MTRASAPADATEVERIASETKAIKSIQQGLSSLGFETGAADGIVGNRTVGAVNAWINSLQNEDQKELAQLALNNDDFNLLEQMMRPSDRLDIQSADQILAEALQSRVIMIHRRTAAPSNCCR